MIYLTDKDNIAMIPFSMRLYNGLKRAGLETIGNLLDYSQRHSWADIHALGEKSISEISDWLDKLESASGNYAYVSDSERSLHLTNATEQELLQYVPIRDLPLSTQAKNSLLESGLTSLNQVNQLSEEELLSLKRMGKKAAKEILEFCSSLGENGRIIELLSEHTTIDPRSLGSAGKHSPERLKSTGIEQWEEFIAELVNAWGGSPKSYVQLLTDVLEKHPDAQGETVYYLMYEEPLIRDKATASIFQMIEKRLDGISRERIERLIPKHLHNTTILEEILLFLDNEGKIASDGDYYHCVYPSFDHFLASVDNEKDQKAIQYLRMRLEGKTLAEVGDSFGMTRERVRQVTVRFLKKTKDAQRKGLLPTFFAEDKYSYVYETYLISRDDFIIAFDEPASTYNYLTIVGENNNDTKKALDASLEDDNIPVEMRRQLERVVYKDYVYLEGVRIKKERAILVQHYVRTYCRESIAFDDFLQNYHTWLEKYDLLDDQYKIESGTYENRLQACDYALWNQWRRFRYYPIAGRDFAAVIDCIDFEQYENTEISTLKLFRDYPDVMQEYDIQNEYELHNLLKKIWPKEDKRITFHRMPTLEIGKADRDEQVLFLLLQYAPISAEDLAKKYEETYGARAATAQGTFFRNFNEYFYNGIYSIDANNLPMDQFERMKAILVQDCYAISDVRRFYHREFPTEDLDQINPYTLKTLGFHVYSGYIIRNTYSSATEYFNHILTSAPLIDGRALDRRYYEYSAFTQEAARLKSNWEIVEFAPKQYISINRLNENGVTVAQLKDYGISVNKFVEPGACFTVYSLRKSGYSHPLDDLGFDEWFYSSILLEDREHFSYQRIGGTRLFRAGRSSNLFADFLNWLLNRLIKIDIFDLCEMLETEYGIVLPKDKVVELIRNTDLYYDTIMQTVYVDYDTYFEEV